MLVEDLGGRWRTGTQAAFRVMEDLDPGNAGNVEEYNGSSLE